MRFLALVLMVACGNEYSMWTLDIPEADPSCSFESVSEWDGEEILVCSRQTTWQEAEQVCGNYGGELLVSPGWYAAQSEIADIGSDLIGDAWHVGWPEHFTCPAMSHLGGSSPRYSCEARQGFMCSFRGEL
jgi:hypothetical protein